jgi:hypothetical protein
MPVVFLFGFLIFGAAPAAIIEAQPDAPPHHVMTEQGDSLVSG